MHQVIYKLQLLRHQSEMNKRQTQHTGELISAWNTQHKDNNKDLSCLW